MPRNAGGEHKPCLAYILPTYPGVIVLHSDKLKLLILQRPVKVNITRIFQRVSTSKFLWWMPSESTCGIFKSEENFSYPKVTPQQCYCCHIYHRVRYVLRRILCNYYQNYPNIDESCLGTLVKYIKQNKCAYAEAVNDLNSDVLMITITFLHYANFPSQNASIWNKFLNHFVGNLL